MFEKKQNGPEENGPFSVAYNFRSVSTRSSKLSKKHRIRKLSDTPMAIGLKKNRKMTQNIEVEGILEEKDLQAEARCAMSQAQMEPEEEPNVDYELENCEIWESPDLQKVIPVQLNEHELDEESPFEMSSFRHMYSFEEMAIGQKQ